MNATVISPSFFKTPMSSLNRSLYTARISIIQLRVEILWLTVSFRRKFTSLNCRLKSELTKVPNYQTKIFSWITICKILKKCFSKQKLPYTIWTINTYKQARKHLLGNLPNKKCQSLSCHFRLNELKPRHLNRSLRAYKPSFREQLMKKNFTSLNWLRRKHSKLNY